MWRKFREDKEEDAIKAFNNDCATCESFNPDAYIKEPEEKEACKKILLENFDIVKIAYMEMLAKSFKTYPEISAEVFIGTMMKERSDADKKMLPAAKFEVAFILTTKTDSGKGLNGTLCRGELFDVILRMGQQLYLENKDKGMEENLKDFIMKYLYPIQ